MPITIFGIGAQIGDKFIEPITRQFLEWYSQWPWIGILLGLMLTDVLTGLIAAFITKQLSSKVSASGMNRKIMMLLMVGTCAFVERLSGLQIAKLASGYYCVTEIMSIIENADTAGVPVPPQLRSALATFRSQKRFDRRKPGAPPTAVINVENVEKDGQVNVKVDEKKAVLTPQGFKTDGP